MNNESKYPEDFGYNRGNEELRPGDDGIEDDYPPDPEYDEDDWDSHYISSVTAGDYSPSCPWNAPGMSIHDFI